MKQFLRRLKWLLQRRKKEADLQSELDFYLATEAEERFSNGVSETEAMSAACRELGNLTLVKEDTRATWGWVILEDLIQDLHYGWRGLCRNRAFAATAVLSLALGIGANTAIFSLLDALLLRWLPVRDPQQLVQLKFRALESKEPDESFSYPLVHGLAERKDIFAGLTGFSGWTFRVGPPGASMQVQGALVTGQYYGTLGLNPVLGRFLTTSDDRLGSPPVAVISYEYWRQQYSTNSQAVGKTILLNGAPVTIVGVSPPGFVGVEVGAVANITIPVAALPVVDSNEANLLGPGNFWLRVMARPEPGFSLNAASARLAILWPRLCERLLNPNWPLDQRLGLSRARLEFARGGTGWTDLRARFRKPLLVLMAIVALVLLIACANLTNLLLARITVRQREIAVRLAIGASRARVIRQFLTESILLATLGAALGIVFAFITGSSLVSVLSTYRQQVVFDLRPNWHVLAFAVSVAVTAAILFGVIPALRATRDVPSGRLKEDSRMSRSRMLSSLVVAQVALSFLLLIGAGLFVRTLRNLESVDPGFQRDGVLLVDLEGRRTTLPKHLLFDLSRVPGVISASVSTHTPLSGSVWSEPAVPRGQPLPEKDTACFIAAGPAFFDTLQMHLTKGRDFTEHDTGEKPTVAVVNQAFARRFFPATDAVGRYLSASVIGRRADLQIVGVVQNVDLAGLGKTAPPAVYVPYYQLPTRDDAGKDISNFFPSTFEVRAAGSLSTIAASIRKQLQAQLPDVSLDIHSLSTQVEATLVQQRLVALLAAVFGGLALALSFVGVYGLLAYSVARQTREVGIRMALGAPRIGILRMILAKALGMTALGIGLGLPAAVAASRSIQSMLFGLTPTDRVTVIGSMLLLTVATVFAAYIPARRAANVDPMAALRHE